MMMLVAIPLEGVAEVVTGSVSFVMGDNDSRNDARNICHLGAKRQALEKAGVYIEAQTRVENLRLKSQDVLAFTAAMVRVEEAGHSVAVVGDQQTVNCTARLVVDPDDLRKSLAQYAGDSTLQERLREQQQRMTDLESRISSLTASLRSVDDDKAVAIRRQRQEAVLDVRAVEAAVATWSAREDRLQRLKRLAVEYVRIGMTRDEVRAILGPPDGTTSGQPYSRWSYGPDAKVLFIMFDRPGNTNGLHGDGYVLMITDTTTK